MKSSGWDMNENEQGNWYVHACMHMRAHISTIDESGKSVCEERYAQTGHGSQGRVCMYQSCAVVSFYLVVIFCFSCDYADSTK